MKTLVVGGGIAGVSIAAELATDHEVVLLEAESTLAVHTTGRSAAIFLLGYGTAAVRALTARSEGLFAELSEAGPALLTERGAVVGAFDDAAADVFEDHFTGLEQITPRQLHDLCPAVDVTQVRKAAYDRLARDIDVMALHARYVRELRRLGGQVVTGARITHVDRTDSWQVTAATGQSWSGDVLVNAAGAWGDELPRLAGLSGHGLVPKRRTIVISRPPAGVDPRWPIVGDAGESWYFKPEGAALLLSPGDETETDAGDARPDPSDVALTLDRVNAVTTLGLRSVQSSWAGLRTFAPDRTPVVGPHPDDPALFCFVGQGGYGIQMGPALARLGADLLRGNPVEPSLAAALSPARLVTAAS